MTGAPLDVAQAELLLRIQSPSPTRYRVRAGAHSTYVYCAFDALLFAWLTAQSVLLEADPPVGRAFAATLDPQERALPQEAALPEERPAPQLWLTFTEEVDALPRVVGMPSNRCPYLHLFERREDAERWRESLPDELRGLVRILPLEDAWRAARERALRPHPRGAR